MAQHSERAYALTQTIKKATKNTIKTPSFETYPIETLGRLVGALLELPVVACLGDEIEQRAVERVRRQRIRLFVHFL